VRVDVDRGLPSSTAFAAAFSMSSRVQRLIFATITSADTLA
jgi:hypothetical protein